MEILARSGEGAGGLRLLNDGVQWAGQFMGIGSAYQDVVGEIDLRVQLDNGTDSYISVLLHHSWGKLTYLEVVWYEFPEPVPSHWTELSREVRVTVE